MTDIEKGFILRLYGWYKAEREISDDSEYIWVHNNKERYIFTLESAFQEHSEIGYDN